MGGNACYTLLIRYNLNNKIKNISIKESKKKRRKIFDGCTNAGKKTAKPLKAFYLLVISLIVINIYN